MLHEDSPIYLRDPRESERRVLLRGWVRSAGTEELTAEFDPAKVLLGPGDELALYYKEKQRFVQRPARCLYIEEEDVQTAYRFRFIGSAISAEGREHYRASGVSADICAAFGVETNCPVLDVSATGLALHSRSIVRIGQRLRIKLVFEGQAYSGEVTVQSAREIYEGKMRYGLRCLDEPPKSSLCTALAAIDLQLQRRMLARRSRID